MMRQRTSYPFRGGNPAQLGEGLARVLLTPRANATSTRCHLRTPPQEYSLEPLHHLRWSPSPEGEDVAWR